ncbi:MAG: cytochrome c [Burkholderiaceae bacterium]|nr:cytochrome c [Burkholderiaceae bacterium]
MKKSLLLATLALASLSAHAQFAKVEDAAEYRQAALSVMGTHFHRIGEVVKGDKPYDKATTENDAAIVDMLAKLPWSAFPPNSIVGDSKARPEIWTQQDKFKADADKLQAATQKLSAAAKTGDLAAIKTAFGDTAKQCKACHQDFKKKD